MRYIINNISPVVPAGDRLNNIATYNPAIEAIILEKMLMKNACLELIATDEAMAAGNNMSTCSNTNPTILSNPTVVNASRVNMSRL